MDRHIEKIIGIILVMAGFLQFFGIDSWPIGVIMPILVFLCGLTILFVDELKLRKRSTKKLFGKF